MLERQLDRVQDLGLDARQPADVVPRDVWDLGRADALRVGRPGGVERRREVGGREGDAGVGEGMQRGGSSGEARIMGVESMNVSGGRMA